MECIKDEAKKAMINVYMAAASKINNGEGDTDWYGVLGVDPSVDDQAVKKQYKKLALLLHPDKNKCNGAEGAFKLVSEAWNLLSDKNKRNDYDEKRKSKEAKFHMQKPPSPNGNANAEAEADDGANANAKADDNDDDEVEMIYMDQTEFTIPLVDASTIRIWNTYILLCQ
ncbi:unnamed protein product [Microthlaspi erraticum]|uniref:J domain-containing protein n=1 Tax=Microthlaspi erraticum TaxID=1685480 RepID=A0A6D2KRZ8_9BRAS|nr:unnamed protein product [Microthlaspi erraticum]